MTLLNDIHTDWNVADSDVREAIATLHTGGDGYWSDVAKAVRITELRLVYVNDDEDFGELHVCFNTDDWRPDSSGLIYTDSVFKAELCEYLTSIGLGTDVSYSEQGMQGDNYVSCDVEGEFLASYKAKFTDKYAAALN